MFSQWIISDLLPIFIPVEKVQTLIIWGMSCADFVHAWVVLMLIGMPTLAIYCAIKKGRRLL